jgi:hypothetical protein
MQGAQHGLGGGGGLQLGLSHPGGGQGVADEGREASSSGGSPTALLRWMVSRALGCVVQLRVRKSAGTSLAVGIL